MRTRLLVGLVALVVVAAVIAAVSQRRPAAHASGAGSSSSSADAPASADVTTAAAPAGAAMTSVGRSASQPAPSSTSAPLQAPVPAPTQAVAVGVPRRLIVAKIHVNTTLQSLGLLGDGTLQSPSKWEQAGWFAKGTRPGDVGPAVIAGHVDSYLGPAVFFRLSELKIGDDIQVEAAGGGSQHFTVRQVQRFPKSNFPTDAVYGPTPLAELKLITCTGDFDRSKRSYVDNLVVTAVLK